MNHEPGTREGNANSGKVGLRLCLGDFSGGQAVKTLPSRAGDMGSISDLGAKILCAPQPGKKKNIKQKDCCNRFN